MRSRRHDVAGRRCSTGLLAGLLLATACVPAAHLTRRHATAAWRVLDESAPARVRLSVQVHEAPEVATGRSIHRLGSTAQAALLQFLVGKASDAGELFAWLEDGPRRTELVIDRTTFGKRLVFSVQKRMLDTAAGDRPLVGPADRLSRTEIAVALHDGEFVGWSRLETEYATIDLGSMQLGQRASVRGALGAGSGDLSAAPLDVSLGAEIGVDQREEIQLRQRIESLTPILERARLTLSREGVVGTDLAGSSTFDVQLRWAGTPAVEKVVRLDGLRHQGKPAEPGAVDLQWVTLSFLPQAQPLSAAATIRYELRTVRAGGETISEHDDDVQFLIGAATTSPVELVSRSETEVVTYRLLLGANLVFLRDRAGAPHPLQFASYDEARGFVDWLVDREWQEGAELGVAGYHLIDVDDQNRVLVAADLGRLHVDLDRKN